MEAYTYLPYLGVCDYVSKWEAVDGQVEELFHAEHDGPQLKIPLFEYHRLIVLDKEPLIALIRTTLREPLTAHSARIRCTSSESTGGSVVQLMLTLRQYRSEIDLIEDHMQPPHGRFHYYLGIPEPCLQSVILAQPGEIQWNFNCHSSMLYFKAELLQQIAPFCVKGELQKPSWGSWGDLIKMSAEDLVANFVYSEDQHDVSHFLTQMKQNLLCQQSIHCRFYVHEHLKTEWFELLPVSQDLDADGNVAYYRGVLKNIHESKETQIHCKSGLEKLEQLMDRAPFGMFCVDLDASILFANREYHRITQLQTGTAVGHGWLNLFPAEMRQYKKEEWIQGVRDGIFFDEIANIHRADGVSRWVRVLCQRDKNADEALGLVIDITDCVQAKESIEKQNVVLAGALEQASLAARVKSEFLATISHEVRTPLNGVFGTASLLLGENLTTEQIKLVRVIQECSSDLLSMLTDVIDLSKLESEVTEIQQDCFCIRQCINQSMKEVQGLALPKNLQLDVNINQNVPKKIMGDKAKIMRIMSVLLNNAVKFTEKGFVKIRVSANSRRPNECISSNLTIVVQDSGIGIDPTQLHKLFRAFSQVDSSQSRQYGGVGLGLVLAKRLAETMDAKLNVESSPGQGSTFLLDLPLQFDLVTEYGNSCAAGSIATSLRTVPTASLPASWSNEFGDLTVLVVEDNRLGVKPDVALDGQESLDKTKEKIYDIIFMDVSMPGITGIEATKSIRERKIPLSDQPFIVAVTANVFDDDRKKCFACGMDQFISKPYRMDDLKRALKEGMQKKLHQTFPSV